ncbi:MAG: cupin domain-containing protein [Candidatus Thorarchaeota archaeon]|jgi:mannose-6-phosphate isomerase-like protein (cupin superfamily)
MNQSTILDWSELTWESTKPAIATGVLGSRIVPDGASVRAVTLTRVEPKGEFSPHIDDYDHIFLFIEGKGVGWLGEDSYDIKPRLIVRVPAGQSHSYSNTTDSDLILLTINYSVI